jgi:cell division septum initiation protein DivIVA
VDVHKKLDEIVEVVQGARSMPMSASCVVNRAELLAMLEEVRDALPGSLAQAQELIGGREELVEQARHEAEQIIRSARAEVGSLVSDTQVARQSQDEADRILSEARREADEIRAEADDYVDSKLANFEVVLTKTIGSVDRGREKLLGRGPGLDEQGYADEDAPEPSDDPQTLIQRADQYVDTKLGAFEAVLTKTLDAVGRGRQKLHGRIATDDLGAHMAAQDAAGHQHTSDADYLAGLAEIAEPAPERERQDAYAYRQPEPQPPAQPDPYPYQPQEAYASYQQPDPYAASGYGGQETAYGNYQHQDAYGYGQPQPPVPAQPPAPPQYQPQAQQGAALDETSLFDTGMIDLDQLNRYEQGR